MHMTTAGRTEIFHRKMLRVSFLLLLIPVSLLISAEDQKSPAALASAKVKEPPRLTEQDEHDGLGWCKEDQGIAGICIACAQLPGALALPPGECCSDPEALDICRVCVRDPSRCVHDVMDLVQQEEALSQEMHPAHDKRYGIMWFGQNPVFVPSYTGSKKTFGALYSGSEDNSDEEPESQTDKRWGSLGIDKRYGTLHLGSFFGKRFAMLGLGSRYLGQMARGYGNVNVGKRFGTLNLGGRTVGADKRFGTLNMGKRWGTLNMGKRWGTLNMGKKWGTLNMGKKNDQKSDIGAEKRYGTLNLGKRYGSLNMGGTYGAMSLGKRYGTLGMGGSYGYYPFKRSEYVPYNGDIGIDMKKRYGRLFLGRLGG